MPEFFFHDRLYHRIMTIIIVILYRT